jgi:hypothetical protein
MRSWRNIAITLQMSTAGALSQRRLIMSTRNAKTSQRLHF